MIRIACLILFLTAIGCDARKTASAPPAGGPLYRCAFTKIAPTIDGKIDDEAWKNAAWTGDFVGVVGGDKAALRTRVRMLWDDQCLYIAAEMEEPDVRGDRTEHDDKLYLENVFEVFIDPDHDGQNYAELEINALNTTMDLTMEKPYSRGGQMDLDWSAEGMKTAVHVDGTINDGSDQDRGWTVEMSIPWSALKKLAPEAVPPRDGVQWRVELARISGPEDSGRSYWVWSPTGAVDFHLPEKWGWVEFVR